MANVEVTSAFRLQHLALFGITWHLAFGIWHLALSIEH
jgi:hypothetical protein